MLKGKYRDFFRRIKTTIPTERLITDPLRTITYGIGRQFLPPDPQDRHQRRKRKGGAAHPAGSRHNWSCRSPSGPPAPASPARRSPIPSWSAWAWAGTDTGSLTMPARSSLQPGIIGGHANRILAEFDRKIGPDPASIDSAKIGGILANNASGMCCGVEQNSYRTLDSMRIILADGTVVDTADDKSRADLPPQPRRPCWTD